MTQFSDMVARLARLNSRVDALTKAGPKSGGQTLTLKSAPADKPRAPRLTPSESTLRLIERVIAKHNQAAGASWQRANLRQALAVWRRGAAEASGTEIAKSTRGLARLDGFLSSLSTGCQAQDPDLLPSDHPHFIGA